MKSDKVTITFVYVPLKMVSRVLVYVSEWESWAVLGSLVITDSDLKFDVLSNCTLLPTHDINADWVDPSTEDIPVWVTLLKTELLVNTSCFSSILQILIIVDYVTIQVCITARAVARSFTSINVNLSLLLIFVALNLKFIKHVMRHLEE